MAAVPARWPTADATAAAGAGGAPAPLAAPRARSGWLRSAQSVSEEEGAGGAAAAARC